MAASFSVYYVVRPTPNLLTFLAEHPQAKALRQGVVVSREEPFPVDHDYPGQTADCETFAKLCYLAKLERDRMNWSKERDLLGADADALSELFGSVRLTVATFDRWWSLERIGLGFEDLDRLIEKVPLDVLRKIEGPRDRSAPAEEAARERERRFAERRNAGFDEVTGLPIAELPALPPSEWPSSVGTWWEEVIARRAQHP